MTVDYGAVGDAIAARYAAGVLATPSGAAAIRSATADAPAYLGATPCVVVFPDSGDLAAGDGTRLGTATWRVQLFYAELGANDLERDMNQLRDWLGVLLDAHLTGMQLGATVARCVTVGWRIAKLTYAGTPFSGIELRVMTVTTEAWAPSA